MVYMISLLAFSLITTIGLSSFHTRGEAREALVVQSMYSRGNLVLPRAYNDAIPSKPPLFHWMSTAISHLMGSLNEYTIRLPSLLLSLCTLIFFMVALKAHLSNRAQAYFLLLLPFSFEWLRASLAARVDMVHSACLSCGLLCAFLALEKNNLRFWFANILLIGLATLGKGPVAILIPAIILGVWVFISRQRLGLLRPSLNVIVGLAISAMIALSWYVLAYLEAPKEFIEKTWYENVDRFVGAMADQPHQHTALYIIVMLLVGTLPWSPLIIWLLSTRLPASRQGLWKLWNKLEPLEKYSILCVTIIIIFYSIPGSKRGVYLLAAYPFLFYLTALAADKNLRLKPVSINRIFYSFLFTVLIGQTVLEPFLASKWTEKSLAIEVKKHMSNNEKIYSFGYEFYAASYYMNKTFLRLEDTVPEKLKAFEQGFLILRSRDAEKLQLFLKEKHLAVRKVTEEDLGTEKAILAKIYLN